MSSGYELERFVEAQEAGGTYSRALSELRAGRKSSHWMWFVFPQLAGLGRSPTAQRYAIGSLEEAREYLSHPVLGGRLRECTGALLDVCGRSAEEILGGIDAMKLRSSMTLFGRADPDEPGFAAWSRSSLAVKGTRPRCGCSANDNNLAHPDLPGGARDLMRDIRPQRR